MQVLSLQNTIIFYDPDTQFQNLDDILRSRLWDGNLSYTLDDLHDPFLLPDMHKAVERIKKAYEDKEKVMIFGDYDVDGATSTALLMHFFTKIWFAVSYRLPTREKDGYGMKNYFIDEIGEVGATLIVTVDCGTRDIEVIKYAKKKGIDVIVTDHHAVPEYIPEEAIAIINPKRTDSKYPFSYLCGAWVAFKLICALIPDFFPQGKIEEYIISCLDIVALGTTADCMPLTWENRALVMMWLEQLKNTRSKGIEKIIAERKIYDLDADIFGFTLGPRLNAAGRIDIPHTAVQLLLNNSHAIDDILADIEAKNEQRKLLSQEFFQDALETIDDKNQILFYDSVKIPHGIIGLVAGKLTEIYFRPSIVLKDCWEKLVASCRSPEHFSLVEYLEKYKEYFVYFGWHKQAAGFTIRTEKYEEFRKVFTADVNTLDFSDKRKTISITQVLSPDTFGMHLLDTVLRYKPYGMGYEKPLFALIDFPVERVEYMGKNIDHITIKNRRNIPLLGFNLGKYYDEIRGKKVINLVIDVFEDYWMGKRQVKAKIVDIF